MCLGFSLNNIGRSEIFALNSLSEATYQDKAVADQIFEALLAESEETYGHSREVVESAVHKDLNRYRYIHYEGKAWSHGKVQSDRLATQKEMALDNVQGAEVEIVNPGKTHLNSSLTKCAPAKTSLASTLSAAQELEVVLGAKSAGDQAYTHKHTELKGLISTFDQFLKEFRLKLHESSQEKKDRLDEECEAEACVLDEMFAKSAVHNDGMKLAVKTIKKSL